MELLKKLVLLAPRTPDLNNRELPRCDHPKAPSILTFWGIWDAAHPRSAPACSPLWPCPDCPNNCKGLKKKKQRPTEMGAGACSFAHPSWNLSLVRQSHNILERTKVYKPHWLTISSVSCIRENLSIFLLKATPDTALQDPQTPTLSCRMCDE